MMSLAILATLPLGGSAALAAGEGEPPSKPTQNLSELLPSPLVSLTTLPKGGCLVSATMRYRYFPNISSGRLSNSNNPSTSD